MVIVGKYSAPFAHHVVFSVMSFSMLIYLCIFLFIIINIDFLSLRHRVALPYPWGCDAAGSEVECTRGVYNRRWYYLGIYLFNFLCIVYVSLAMYAVYKTVSDIEHNANRYSFISAFRGQNRKNGRFTTSVSQRSHPAANHFDSLRKASAPT